MKIFEKKIFMEDPKLVIFVVDICGLDGFIPALFLRSIYSHCVSLTKKKINLKERFFSKK